MCGLAGFFSPDGFRAEDGSATVERMAALLRHRGPDDHGAWCDAEAGIALGHRRLSIIELSRAGAQPMRSACGRYVISFNGEIYNHLDLRKTLSGAGADIRWRGQSDTETLLAALSRWGVERALRECCGMFAFALWDRDRHELVLARDRMGEKPLYYGWQGRSFLFASELKAFRAHPDFESRVDRIALASYFKRHCITAPRSIYRGISNLLPGTYVRLRTAGPAGPVIEESTYWSLLEVAERGIAARTEPGESEAVDVLDASLRAAVLRQTIADVPLGAFLSGGIDSTLIVALLQDQSSRPVKTFTIGFDEPDFDEAPYARAIAAHLGTEHTELEVRPQDAMDVIPGLPSLYDEPFGDSSAVPTFLVCRLARSQVTVALSGDGGDELFGGYTRYHKCEQIRSNVIRLPYALRRPLGAGLVRASGLAPATRMGWRASRLGHYLRAANDAALYDVQVSQRHDEGRLVRVRGHGNEAWGRSVSGGQLLDVMMLSDGMTYLPADILTKVDRASMAVSLESRVPMLDHHVVEHAWRLPLALKVRNGRGKWILRQVLRRYVPDRLIERPKKGFGVPVGQWLRGPLRPWAEDLIDQRRVREEGYLDPQRVRSEWNRHLQGDAPSDDRIWPLLVFQQWLRAQGDVT